MTKRGMDGEGSDRSIAGFGILGPVEGWTRDGRLVRITPGQARVLAVLLESANEVISAETLRDRLWPGDDPEDSAALLYVNISSIRRLLGRPDDGTATLSLERRGTGYELRVGRLDLDWFRYQRLVAAAARAIAAERHAEAKLFLLDARRLWRGEALMGVPEEFRGPFADHMEAARTEANLRLVDAGLALGEHRELIPPLRHMTGREPLDEFLASRLMLALFRSGRQAEALDVYEACRRRLAESGLVPTPVLAGMEFAILTRAESVLAPGPAAHRDPPWSAIEGTILVGRWPSSTPPPWAQGDAELTLIVEDEGGELLAAETSSVISRFDDRDRALAAAARIQNGLRARGSGLGRLVVHDGSMAATRGARLLALCERMVQHAQPGQVLSFRSTEAPDARWTAQGLELRDLGEHYASASDPAVRVYQLVEPEWSEAQLPPSFNPRPAPNHNLPAARRRCIGRESVVEQVALMLSSLPLVTLTGPGGVGKTRLAVEIATRLVAEYRDGTWLVELEWLTDPDLLTGAVAAAMDLDPPRGLPVDEWLFRELAGRQILLVLDGGEHHLAAVRAFVDRLVGMSPQASVLATSQRALGCAQEAIVAVPPLAAPTVRVTSTAEELRANPAVRLFVDCHRPATVGDAEILHVAQICELVDGLPLTIALAAGRARQLGLPDLVSALEATLASGGALRLLDAGGKLERMLDWTFSLLDEDDRRTLVELSMMVGAFTLDEARAFCGSTDIAASLCQLADCSALIVEDAHGAVPRYRLLQPVREFGAARLDGDPDRKERLSRRHAELFLGVAEAADRAFGGPDEHEQLARLDECIGNLRAALARSIAMRQADVAIGLGASLWRYWFTRGHLAEGLTSLLATLALDGRTTPAGIRALGGSSYLSWWLGDLPYTRKSAEETAERAEEIDDAWGRAWAPLGLVAAGMFSPSGPPPGVDLRPAISWFVEAGHRWEAAMGLQLEAGLQWYAGDYEGAATSYGRVVELNRSAGSKTFMDALPAHGLMLALLGKVEDGIREIQAGLELADSRRDAVGACHALAYRAAIARYEDDFDEAARLYTLALRTAHETGEAWIVMWALDGLAAAAATNRPEVAARLLGRVESLGEATCIRLAPREREDHETAVSRVRANRSAAAERALNVGRSMSTAEAVEMALGLGV